jgi:hypothetical protein
LATRTDAQSNDTVCVAFALLVGRADPPKGRRRAIERSPPAAFRPHRAMRERRALRDRHTFRSLPPQFVGIV